jgi:hypothetical protein
MEFSMLLMDAALRIIKNRPGCGGGLACDHLLNGDVQLDLAVTRLYIAIFFLKRPISLVLSRADGGRLEFCYGRDRESISHAADVKLSCRHARAWRHHAAARIRHPLPSAKREKGARASRRGWH